MGRFAEKHPPYVREAIVRAVIHDGMTQSRARAMLRAGELYDAPAYTISASTASGWVTVAKKAMRPKLAKLADAGDFDSLTASVQARLAAVLERDLAHVERDSWKGPIDARRLERLAVAADRIVAMGKPIGTRSTPKDQDQSEGTEGHDQASPLLTQLTKAAGNGESSSTTNGEGGSSPTPHAHDPAPSPASELPNQAAA